MIKSQINRRRFLGLAATAAAGTALAACAPQAATAPTAMPQATTAPTNSPPAKDPVTIRVHHRVGGECDNWTILADEYNKANPGVKVVAECFPGADYFKKLNTMAAGGTLGDVFWISSIEGYYRLAASGVCAQLDDLVASNKFDLSPLYKTCVDAAKLKGKLFGLPQLSHPGRVGLYYSKPLFDQMKVDYPTDKWTYDDLMTAAQKLADPKNGVFGFRSGSDYFHMLVWARARGGDVINSDGTKCTLDQPEAVAALQFQSDLVTSKAAAIPSVVGYTEMMQLFAAKKLAMYQEGFWGNGAKDYVKEGEWGVAPMPLGATGKRGSMFESDPACLSATSKNADAAFKWMTTMVSKEAQLRYFQKTGSPSSRPDVMNSPEVQADMNMKVYAGVMESAMPLVLPANFRETEYFKTITEGVVPIWLGEKKVTDIVGPLTKIAQEILDKPAL